jgi:AcrR family transcriptional regulator
METLEKIRTAYTEFVLEHGHPPVSVFQFVKQLDLPESTFYDHYASFDAIEADVWLALFQQARATVEADSVYDTYSVREKLLAYYYTWIEVLKGQRSFAVYSYGRLQGQSAQNQSGPRQPAALRTRRMMNNAVVRPFKDAFNDFARDLLAEGRESKEVEPRPFLSDRYADALWLQVVTVLDFWVRDTSKGFEKTDTFIEKSVNTAFDLFGRSPLDSVFDLVKFRLQN